MYLQKRKIFYSSVLVVFLAIVSFTPQKAQAYWSDAIPAAFIKQALEVAYDQIQGAILGAQKALSVQVLYQQVVDTISGSGGEALFVTDIDDFLNIQPKKAAELVLNDFLSDVTRGQDVCSYVTEWIDPDTGDKKQTGGINCDPSDGLNFAQSYLQQITDDAEKYVLGEVGEQAYSILSEVCPSDIGESMFDSGNLQCFNTFMHNSGWKLNIEAAEVYAQAEAEKVQENVTQFIAGGGYLPKTETISDGSGGTKEAIITPASLIEEISGQVHEIGTLFAAGTTSPSELFSYLAGAYVNRMIMGALNNGLGDIKSILNGEVGQITKNIGDIFGEIEDVDGPGANWEPIFKGTTRLDS